MKKDLLANFSACLAAVFAGASWADDLEIVLRIVASVLSIAAVAVSLIFTLKAWLKKASADGKITEEEAKEAIKIAEDGLTAIKPEVDKIAETAENKEKR